jgi:hypothetical protein
MQEGLFNTTHSNSHFHTVRIIRPHHPFFGKSFPVIRTWKHKKQQFYIIQLPDMSHIQIPVHWADEGKIPLSKNFFNQPVFTINSIREIISAIKLIVDKS